MLNKEFKAKWLEKLRDKSYKQGLYYLRNGRNEFCCLGVACDIYDPNKWIRIIADNLEYYEYDRCNATVPPELRVIVGLSNEDLTTLMYMNDSRGHTFEEIADWIEVNL